MTGALGALGRPVLEAIEEAVRDKLARMDRSRLARESAKLDPRGEREMAGEGLDEIVGG